MAKASQTIIEKIQTILRGVDGIPDNAVYLYEPNEMGNFPVIAIVETGNEAEFDTNKDNERIYRYTIRIFVERAQAGVEKCEANLRNIRDDIIDALDSDSYFTGISLPTGYTMINTFAAPMRFGYIAGREGELRAAEIDFRVRILVDTLAV